MNRNGFINVALVFLVAAFSGGATYYVMTKEAIAPKEEVQVPILTSETSSKTPSCDGEMPVITSISATSSKIGGKIELVGCNFSGFEGDKTAWIENDKGEKGILYGDLDSTETSLKLTLQPSVCKEDTSYSGHECQNELVLIPGEYQVYVYPWGKMSNKISLTIK